MTIESSGCLDGIPSPMAGHGLGSQRTKFDSTRTPSSVAIVGMACRFPGGVGSAEEMWSLHTASRQPRHEDVQAKRDDQGDPPIIDQSIIDMNLHGTIDDGANITDRLVKMVLEVVFEATEDAGLPIEKLAGPASKTAVFTSSLYKINDPKDTRMTPDKVPKNNGRAVLCDEISRHYDFQGPSMSIDADSSSTMAALHQACQTLRWGESTVSIVAAPWDTLKPSSSRALRGLSVLVLKCLDAAQQDNDRIHAVIRNSALGHDNHPKELPSIGSSIVLAKNCYQQADVEPSETGYLEVHTVKNQGTNSEAYQPNNSSDQIHLALDSGLLGTATRTLDSNEEGAGLASVIVAAMAMKKVSALVDHDNVETGNQQSPPHNSTGLIPWPMTKALRTSIITHTHGGATAHVILEGSSLQPIPDESATSAPELEEDKKFRLYILSARSREALQAMGRTLAEKIRELTKDGAAPSSRDLAYTLSERRSLLSWISVVRASSLSQLADRLEDEKALTMAKTATRQQQPRLAFVFSGQGAQWYAMGRELLDAYPVFSSTIDQADSVFRNQGARWSLRTELLQSDDSTRVSEIHLGYPTTVALQVCLVVLLRSWGVYPSAITSHSSGEIAAAYACGALSFEQALSVAYWTGELARTTMGLGSSGIHGAMAAGGVGSDVASKYVESSTSKGRAVVACVNSQHSVTFAGDAPAVDDIVLQIEADGHFARRLKVPLAYHSHHMLQMESTYRKKLRTIVPAKPTWTGDVLYSSPTTGAIVDSAEMLGPGHYVNNLTGPVLFKDAFERMCFGPDGALPAQVDIVIEIGPHNTLAAPMRQILQKHNIAVTSCLKRYVNAVETMHNLVSQLVSHRYPIRMEAVNGYTTVGVTAQRTDDAVFFPGLPRYPWQHDSMPTDNENKNLLVTDDLQDQARLLVCETVWEPDVLHDIPPSIKESLRILLTDEEADIERKHIRSAYYMLVDALESIDFQALQGLTGHSYTLNEWVVNTVAQGETGYLAAGSSIWRHATKGVKQALFDEISSKSHSYGGSLLKVGERLPVLLRRELLTSAEGMEDEIALPSQFFEKLPSLQRSYSQVAKLIQLFAIKTPGARVLEVGGGDGCLAEVVLRAFGREGYEGTLAGQYILTTPSQTTLDSNHPRLAPWSSLLQFHRLDLESEDPHEETSSPTLQDMDLIVVSMRLHAINDMCKVLARLRRMLKPNGRLLLIEPTKARLDTQLISRTALWQGAEHAVRVIGLPGMDGLLRVCGFTGIEFEIGDCENLEYQTTSVIMTSAALMDDTATPGYPVSAKKSAADVLLLSPSKFFNSPITWLNGLTETIRRVTGKTPRVKELDDTSPTNDTIIVVACYGEMNSSANVFDSPDFGKLLDILQGSHGVIWLHTIPDETSPPEMSTYFKAQYFLKMLRQEEPSRPVVMLGLPENRPTDPESIMEQVACVLNRTINTRKKATADTDWEYRVKESTLQIPRVYPITESTRGLLDSTQTRACKDAAKSATVQSPTRFVSVKEQLDLPDLFQSEATYLVVLESGNLGISTVSKLISWGVKNLILVCHKPVGPIKLALSPRQAADEGCNLRVMECDFSDMHQVNSLLQQLSEVALPIRGVLYMELFAPSLSTEQTWSSGWQSSTQSGPVGLRSFYQSMPGDLQFFVVVSSRPGVATPLTADYCTDRNSGPPLTVIDVSLLTLTELEDAEKTLTEGYSGISSIYVQQTFDKVNSVIRSMTREHQNQSGHVKRTKGATTISLVPQSFLKSAHAARDARFSTLRLAESSLSEMSIHSTNAASDTSDPSAMLLQAIGINEKAQGLAKTKRNSIAKALQVQLAKMLDRPLEDVNLDKPVAEEGVDSLIAVELRYWMASVGNVKLSTSDILESPSLQACAALVLERIM